MGAYVYAANALAQLLTVPPYAVTAIVITISSWLSDRLLTRGLFVIVSSAVGGAGYLYVFLFFFVLRSKKKYELLRYGRPVDAADYSILYYRDRTGSLILIPTTIQDVAHCRVQ